MLTDTFIHESGGETSILEIERLSLPSEQMITSKFNQERTLEFDEFIEESNKFLKEIEDETNKEASDLFEECNKLFEEFTEKVCLYEGLVEKKKCNEYLLYLNSIQRGITS